MLDIFRGLKSLIKISHVHIDTAVFRLHYSFTVILLISFSLIVTTRQYVGNPIDCIHSKDLPEDVLNTYCWIHSTYTITAAYRKREGFEVPFPGVDNSKSHPEAERKEYRYYQWVCFMLFLQVIDRLVFIVSCLWILFYILFNIELNEITIDICNDNFKLITKLKRGYMKKRTKKMIQHFWVNNNIWDPFFIHK